MDNRQIHTFTREKARGILLIFTTLSLCVNLAFAQSPNEAKPSFDCAKAKSKIEKMICSDSELSRLDSAMAKEYAKLRKSLDKVARKELLNTQRAWIKAYQDCRDDKECIAKSLQDRIRFLERYIDTKSNAWAGIWSLSYNLYEGEFDIGYCDKSGDCEVAYYAELKQSEFNDLHICESNMTLKRGVKNVATLYFEGSDNKCQIEAQINGNTMKLITQTPSDCDFGCGVGAEPVINKPYRRKK
ncbi:hypothetical protein CCZ01_06970 [Helicobacter monodelphidis]|uniref:lysozyme inhibitor LprI family protein n=1 Tax=Helicobacter sp. 15-1451 TaxID=2004995 RepID=UPI000DCE8069|nr:lysozyme inhibitor LprI family protein [Helicobacter sp. 15-1451]RAX57199.1 hypothetical protein CCZ01_06970 [Helicobacter sp. 15-1451]